LIFAAALRDSDEQLDHRDAYPGGVCTMRAGVLLLLTLLGTSAYAAERPNILWISCEDISPDLGCYGDAYAVTPNLDKLAAEGVRFTKCFTHAGVCAPSRSGLITGMYPPSLGTHHMRCKGVPPADVRCFPEYLRAAGYYCTNNSKTDYQFDPPASAWDESSGQADWRGRAKNQPFFCVINFTTTHESQIRNPSAATQKLVAALSDGERHDPAQAVVPPYYPDTPVVRRDLANYYDNITAMDRQVAEVLARLEADGLAEDTIVWFWGDHGRGLPRCKRWLYDSGTQTPLIVRVPKQWRAMASPKDEAAVGPGKTWDELVAFVDFAPTVLSLAGLRLPPHFQGQAFLGPAQQPPREYVYGHRDRMDEAYDLIRTVRDGKFRYFRNFLPDVPYAQDIAYMNEMPTMQELRRLHAEGKLVGPPTLFFRATKPVEELFDCEADPHQIHNLAGDPKYTNELDRLRAECLRWMTSIGDVGLIPEAEFDELKRPGGEYAATTAPIVEEDIIDGQRQITLLPSIPGSSLLYRWDDATNDKAKWKLYAEAFTAPVGAKLQARAVRIGFKDSPPVRWTADSPPTDTPLAMPPSHWREHLVETQLLSRLHDLAALQLREDPQSARQPLIDALGSEHGSVRYWAVRTLSARFVNASNRDRARDRLRQLRDGDPSPVVQITAAKTLAQHGDLDKSLTLLTKYLQAHPQDSVRLAAAIALRDLGEVARPALPALEAAAKEGEYVARVSQAAIRNLRSK
jgi:N-sulfoglucosamine sulfohydrolase